MVEGACLLAVFYLPPPLPDWGSCVLYQQVVIFFFWFAVKLLEFSQPPAVPLLIHYGLLFAGLSTVRMAGPVRGPRAQTKPKTKSRYSLPHFSEGLPIV